MTRVFAFCPGDIASFRQGIIEPLEELQAQGKLKFRYSYSNSIISYKEIEWCDVLIACRTISRQDMELLRYGREIGKYTVYMMDDDLLSIPFGLIGNQAFRTQSCRQAILENMAQCRCFFSYNALLTKKYSYIFERSVTMNTTAPLLRYAKQKGIAPFTRGDNPEGSIVIGFSGSVTHQAFIDSLLKEPCLRIQKEYPQCEFEFFGVEPSFAAQLKRVVIVPHTSSFDEYCRHMLTRNWTIGLAPLEKNEFTQYKCYNKFIEYTSAGIAGIYSDVAPFTLAVKHNENGIMTGNTTQEWYEAIRYAIEHPELRNRIIHNAMDFIEKNHNDSMFFEQFSQKIPEFVSYKSSKPIKRIKQKEPPKRHGILYTRLCKVYNLFRSDGLSAVNIIFKRITRKLRRN